MTPEQNAALRPIFGLMREHGFTVCLVGRDGAEVAVHGRDRDFLDAVRMVVDDEAFVVPKHAVYPATPAPESADA